MSESWGNDAGVPGFRLGARLRPAPASVPLLRASLAPVQPPQECRWDRLLDLTGDDGQPDALGNDEVGNCVPVAALRQMQLWAHDGRKPNKRQAMELLSGWDGTPENGTFTDHAFAEWCFRGYGWSEQRLIVPRWTLVEQDGMTPNLLHLKRAIHALGGVLAVFDMPASAMTTDPWQAPTAGAESVGYHCVLLAGYDLTAFYAVSWGHVIPVGYAFLISRIRQASAFASDAWVHADGQGGSITPSGLTSDEIRAIGAQVEGV